MTTEEIIKKMSTDKAVRRAIVRRSHKYFFHFYFGHYIQYPIAPLHEDFFRLSEDDQYSLSVISAFRNSGKSTIWSLSYVIWMIISRKVKYAIIISQNQHKSQVLLGHIKEELENNELLRKDLGPFKEERFGWNAVSLRIERYGAKISAHSIEQSIRGLRHLNWRPGLIILDDIEDQESVKTQEGRDKISQWFSGDVVPAGDTNTKIVIIGSILHPDSFIPRLQKGIDAGAINGVYRKYPIIDDEGKPTWPGKFPDTAAVEKEKARGISDREWASEYMLRPMLDEDQVIKQEWIQYYDREPDRIEPRYRYAATGVDLAISENTKSDFTALVSGAVTHEDDAWKIYVLPYPVNERMDASRSTERIVEQSLILGDGQPTKMYIEDVNFQRAIIQQVANRGIPAEGVSPGGTDKRARLASIAALIKNGRVLFPKRGAEKLIMQIIGFGVEKHDDLVDALVYLVLKVSEYENVGQLRFPRLDAPPAQVPTRQELERQADQEIIAKQEARHTPYTQAQILEKQRAESKKYWDVEAAGQLRQMMQRRR